MKPLFFKKLVASLLLSAFFISCFFPQVGLALPVLEYFLKDYRDDSYSFQSEISLELGEKNYPTQGAGLSLIATSHGKNSTQDLTIETSFSQEIYSAGRSSLRLSGALSSQLSSADHHIISSLESLEVSSSSQKWQNQIVKSSALFDELSKKSIEAPHYQIESFLESSDSVLEGAIKWPFLHHVGWKPVLSYFEKADGTISALLDSRMFDFGVAQVPYGKSRGPGDVEHFLLTLRSNWQEAPALQKDFLTALFNSLVPVLHSDDKKGSAQLMTAFEKANMTIHIFTRQQKIEKVVFEVTSTIQGAPLLLRITEQYFFDSPSPLHTSTTSQIIPFDDVRTRLQAELGLADSGGNKIEKIKKIAGTLSEIFGRGNSQHLDEAEISSRATTSVDHYTSIILSRCGDRVCALRELRKLRTQLSNSELKSLRKMLSRHHSLMNTRPSKNS